MANIIERIIAIDTAAQERLDAANRKKEALEQEAAEQIEKNAALIEEKTAQKLEKVRGEEEAKTAEEKANILSRRDETIARLEQLYNDNHQRLEDEIFRAVLGQ